MLNKLASLREKSEDGFTLIELLIVVVIIGILAAIAIPIFLNQQKAAIAGGVKSDVRNTVTNVATYLTKTPQASATQLAQSKVGSNTPTGTGVGNFDIVVSDANTTVAVAGTWQGYTVTGTNSSLTTGSPAVADQFKFDSATGKYTGTGSMLQS